MDIEKMNAELLEWAAECNIKKIKRLLSAGADINIQNNYGETPLFVAVWLNAPVNYIEMLIAAGADHSVRDMYGRTPLHSAAWNGRTQYIRLLLNAGADINARDKKGSTPLHAAARGGSVAAARVLLKTGADPNFRDNMGHTALMISACSGNTCDVEITKLLVKHGADLTLCSDSGEDCAHLASSCGRFRVLKLFLEYGMDINSLDKHGFTGIMRAAQKIDLDTVEKLIEMGADLNVKTKRGEDLSSIIARYHGLRQKKILDIIAGINRLKAEDTRSAPDTGYEFDI